MNNLSLIITPGSANYETAFQCIVESGESIKYVFIIKPLYRYGYIKRKLRKLQILSLINSVAGASLINLRRGLRIQNREQRWRTDLLQFRNTKIIELDAVNEIQKYIQKDTKHHFIVHARQLIPAKLLGNDFASWKFYGGHPGLIHKYRGIHSCFWSKYYGDNEIGWSIFRIGDRIDGGELLMQESFLSTNSDFLKDNERCLTQLSKGFAKLTNRLITNREIEHIPYELGRYQGYPTLTKQIMLIIKISLRQGKVHEQG